MKTKSTKTPDPLDLGFAIPLNPNYTALETELTDVFDESDILKPNDIVNNCKNDNESLSLWQAVTQCGWPTLKDTRGKVMFWLTNDNNNYDFDSKTSLMFPTELKDSVVKLLNNADDPTIPDVVKSGVLVRTRADVPRVINSTLRSIALNSGAHIISTDYPSPSLPENQVPEDIKLTNYNVYLPPSCNPITTNTTTCGQTIPIQSQSNDTLAMNVSQNVDFGALVVGIKNNKHAIDGFLEKYATLLGYSDQMTLIAGISEKNPALLGKIL
eukprot:Pgem_evm2s9447